MPGQRHTALWSKAHTRTSSPVNSSTLTNNAHTHSPVRNITRTEVQNKRTVTKSTHSLSPVHINTHSAVISSISTHTRAGAQQHTHLCTHAQCLPVHRALSSKAHPRTHIPVNNNTHTALSPIAPTHTHRCTTTHARVHKHTASAHTQCARQRHTHTLTFR